MHLVLRARLQVERAHGGDEPEGVGVLLQGDGRARVDLGEVEDLEEFVLCVGFVVREMRGPQHEPALLPRLVSEGRGVQRSTESSAPWS